MRRLLAWCVPNRALCWRTLDPTWHYFEPWQQAIVDATVLGNGFLLTTPRTNGKTVG